MAPVHIALKCFKTERYLILQCIFEKQMSLLPSYYRGENSESMQDGICTLIKHNESGNFWVRM